MLPVARVRGASPLAVARSLPAYGWQWLRPRALPMLVAAVWLGALFGFVRWSGPSAPHEPAVVASAVREEPRPTTFVESVTVEGVDHIVPVQQPVDRCEVDEVLPEEGPGYVMGHTRITHARCKFYIPRCGHRR